MITPKTVPKSIPPSAAEPSVLLPMAPAPVATIKGINPAIKANEVIKIGRKRSFAATIADSYSGFPFSYSSFANSTIRIAFFATNPVPSGPRRESPPSVAR
jgi:hypothetical protein